MHYLMVMWAPAFMGSDLVAAIFDTEDEAKSVFRERFGFEYDRYCEVFERFDEDALTDEDVAMMENAEDMFWFSSSYSETIDTNQDPIQQVAILAVGKDPVMIVGQGTFM